MYGLNGSSIDRTQNIHQIPANLYLKIREELDTNPLDRGWRALIQVAEDRYPIRPHIRERWSQAISGGESPTDKLLSELGSAGMTIDELIKYLDKLKLENILVDLKPYESITITQQPKDAVELTEGNSLYLETEATGFPYPRYQWFVCPAGKEDFTRLVGRTEKVLQINSVSCSDTGTYCCQIHNSSDLDKSRQTDFSVVTVNKRIRVIEPEDKVPYPSLIADLKDDILYERRSTNTDRAPSLISQPHSQRILIGAPFELQCNAVGSPPLNFIWYKNDVPTRVTSQVLQVSDASLDDDGVYYCEVSNIYGDVKTDRVTIRIVQDFGPEKIYDDIVIVSNPKSCKDVEFGGNALFHCEARCGALKTLCYQWFKDGVPIEGATSDEYKIFNIQEKSRNGAYMCEVSTGGSTGPTKRVLSRPAVLTLKIPSVCDNVEYNPSDKVALLIGNYDYRSEQPLKAPISDVQWLTETFRSIDFKVVSLLNLTKSEIESAVQVFCDLLDKNVYAVFYFCGHGFEEDGCSYMVPTDAPTGYRIEECVRADDVLDNIQRKDPPLVCMILDICRKPLLVSYLDIMSYYNFCGYVSNKIKGRASNIPDNLEKKTGKGNTVFCYATSEGLNAYEDKTNGLLVKTMAPLLRERKGVDALFSELKEEFSRMKSKLQENQQLPELRSNLTEVRRSLTDKISWKGQTEVYNSRHLKWLNAHVKPEKQDILVRNIGVIVELDYQADFSNVLTVFCTIKNKGITDECVAYLMNLPSTVSVMGSPFVIDSGKNSKTVIRIQDMQKLKSYLVVTVCLKYRLKGDSNQQHARFDRSTQVNLGMPLVSRLELWRTPEGFSISSREAIEQAEGDSLNGDSLQ